MTTTRNVSTKAAFSRDHTYIRWALRDADQAVKEGRWQDAADIYLEISGVAGTLEAMAFDNHHGIENAHCMRLEEIEAAKEAAR